VEEEMKFSIIEAFDSFVLFIGFIFSGFAVIGAIGMTGVCAYLWIFMGAPFRPFIFDLLLVDSGVALIIFIFWRHVRKTKVGSK
jgi:hypothetical protein